MHISSTRPLAGSERPRHHTHRLLGPVDPEKWIGVTVIVRPSPGSHPLPTLEEWHSTPIKKRRILTREEHSRIHGAHPDDLLKVIEFAHAHGLKVVESHAGRRSVTLEGKPAQFNSAFGIMLNAHEAPLPMPPARLSARKKDDQAPKTYVYHGYDGEIHIPEELHGIILGVSGLDDRIRGVHCGAAGDPSGSSSLSVPDLAGRYNIPNPGASDQTIGIIAPSQTGLVPAYSSNDIIKNYFPSLAAGYTTAPTLNDINLTVSGTTYSNSASAVSSITAANLGASSNGGVFEITQDICTSSTIAQGATVNIYFTQSTEQGWLVFLSRILHPQSENAPTVVSCSWTLELGDDSGYVGKLSDSSSLVSLMTAQFQALAAIGVDVFVAQGDWGADNWWSLGGGFVPDGASHVMYPATDPWVTSCGGTVLGTSAESAWGDAWSSSGFGSQTSNFGSTGGGVSQTFSSPPYQSAAGITGATDSGGTAHTGRGVPDVSGMVGLTGFFVNSIGYSFTGTSCVAPLYAGLAAVLRSAIKVDLGPLNNTLYALKDTSFNDITSGNNSSNDTPANVATAIPGAAGVPANAPYFSAATGWDACTGLGSIDGTKFMNGVASLIYNPNFYFLVNKGSFGLDEVKANADWSNPTPMWLVLEGYTPDAVTAAGVSPSVSGILSGLTVNVGAPQFEISTQTSTPQRVLFPCSIHFASTAIKDINHGGIFPSPGNPLVPTSVPLAPSVTIGGHIFTAETILELEPGADPYFANFDAAGDNAFYLSQDLRVFTVTPGINNAPADGIIALNASDNTHFDTAAGYAYIQALLSHFNSTYDDPSKTNPFTLLPDQTNALSGDSSVTPTSINPADPTGTPFTNYNFAVARVRLGGAPNTTTSDNVRVLFRLFAAQTSDTDYSSLTYPSTSDSKGQPLSPLMGTGNVTIPFFATGNFEANSDFGAKSDYSGNSINNQTVNIGASGEAWAYYGCYLNIYPASNTIKGAAVQSLLPSTHSCIVAQLVYDDAPMPTGPGVIQGPEYSDNFSQRNLQVTFSDNPGPASAHIVPQTFDARPGPAPGSGQLEDYPDELMIEWGNTPKGSKASIYWPQVPSSEVLSLAGKVYSTHQLSIRDAYTVACTVPHGYTFVPISPGTGENFAGLFTVELPQGVISGEEFVITVRRLSTRKGKNPTPPSRIAGQAADQSLTHDPRQVMRNWRYIVGTFAVRVPVSTAHVIRPLEENTLAIMKWRLGQMKPGNRWIPVLKRYISLIEGRLRGLGGNSDIIKPSPWGSYGPPPDKGEGSCCIERRIEVTGKVGGVFYDRFGDFEGFLLLSEEGCEHIYFSREAEMESLVRSVWAERIVVTVVSEADCRNHPVKLVLRRAPPQPRHP